MKEIPKGSEELVRKAQSDDALDEDWLVANDLISIWPELVSASQRGLPEEDDFHPRKRLFEDKDDTASSFRGE